MIVYLEINIYNDSEMEENLMKFGENLRKLRKSKKLSQEDLAEKMKVSRQSVSKWETGEAYPEMNHILELCKIFHCHMNDLVHDSILDVDSLDEEVKRNVVKFKKEKQEKMKGLSKAITIIAKMGRVAIIVCIPIVLATMIITGLIFRNLEVKEGTFKVNSTNDKIEIIEVDDTLKLNVNGMALAYINDANEIMQIKEIFENNSKFLILVYIETGFAFLIGTFALMILLFQSLEKLFANIYKGDTPFTLENVTYIKKIAFFMILITLLPSVGGILFEGLLHTYLGVDFGMFHVIEILVLFSIAYIFEYGYEIQLDSKGKMYGDENE